MTPLRHQHAPAHAIIAHARAAARAIAAAALAALLVAACASAPPAATAPDTTLLAQAGFKTVAADTPQRRQHLQTLAKDSVTEWQQTGRRFYVYPDVAANALYVGTPKEYQAYLALRTKNGLPDPKPFAQSTPDMTNYIKQDTAMEKANALDNQVPPWAIWPDFSNLGWIP